MKNYLKKYQKEHKETIQAFAKSREQLELNELVQLIVNTNEQIQSKK